jgi:hypothetical protein
MSKLLAVFILAFVLSSCSLQGWEVRKAEEICKDHDGIHHTEAWGIFSSLVFCNDGTLYNLTLKKREEE